MMMTWRGFLLLTVPPGVLVAFILWSFRLIPAWGIAAGALVVPAIVAVAAIAGTIVARLQGR